MKSSFIGSRRQFFWYKTLTRLIFPPIPAVALSSAFVVTMLKFEFFIVLASLPFLNLAINLDSLPVDYVQGARTGDFTQLCKFFCENQPLSFHLRGSNYGLQPRIFCGLCKKKLTTMSPSTSTTTSTPSSSTITSTPSSSTSTSTPSTSTLPPTTTPPTTTPSTTTPSTTTPRANTTQESF